MPHANWKEDFGCSASLRVAKLLVESKVPAKAHGCPALDLNRFWRRLARGCARQVQSQMVAGGIGNILLDSNVGDTRDYTGMSERQLNLLNRRLPCVRQPSKTSPQIMRNDG